MNIDYIANPVYIDWLRDNNGNKISLPVNNEQKTVADSKIILDYIPDQFYKVTFDVSSTPTTEISINESITTIYQYKVDYSIGSVYVHPNLESSLLICNYYKRGAIMYPASRIYTELNNNTVESTFQNYIDSIPNGFDPLTFATSAQGILADNALPKSGGTMTGVLVSQSNTSYTTAQVHNIILSTSDAVVGDMNNGDIWIKYV